MHIEKSAEDYEGQISQDSVTYVEKLNNFCRNKRNVAE